MKSSLKVRTVLLSFRFAFIVVLANPVIADPPSAPKPPSQAISGKPTPEQIASSQLLPQVGFEGASMGGLVYILHGKTGINVAVPRRWENIRLPDLHLKNASVLSIIAAATGDPTILKMLPSITVQGSPCYSIGGAMGKTLNLEVPWHDAGLLSKVLPPTEFYNTNIRDFANHLSEETGENIVVPVEAQEYKIPELLLQNVTAVQALQAALNSTGYDFRVVVISSGLPGEARIIRVVSNKPSLPVTENIVTRLYGLRGITGAGDTLPDVANNIEAACLKALDANKKRLGLAESDEGVPDFALHEPTKLLIVTGNQEDLDIVTQVITALGGTPGTIVATPPAK